MGSERTHVRTDERLRVRTCQVEGRGSSSLSQRTDDELIVMDLRLLPGNHITHVVDEAVNSLHTLLEPENRDDDAPPN